MLHHIRLKVIDLKFLYKNQLTSDLSQSIFIVTHSNKDAYRRVKYFIVPCRTQTPKKTSFRFHLKRDTKQMIDLLVKLSRTE